MTQHSQWSLTALKFSFGNSPNPDLCIMQGLSEVWSVILLLIKRKCKNMPKTLKKIHKNGLSELLKFALQFDKNEEMFLNCFTCFTWSLSVTVACFRGAGIRRQRISSAVVRFEWWESGGVWCCHLVHAAELYSSRDLPSGKGFPHRTSLKENCKMRFHGALNTFLMSNNQVSIYIPG